MACILCGSENRLLSFYSSLMGLLDIPHVIETVLLDGVKRVVDTQNEPSVGIVIVHTAEDIRTFNRYQDLVDTRNATFILVVTREELLKVIPKTDYHIVRHSLNLQPLARILIDLNLVNIRKESAGGTASVAGSDLQSAAKGLEFVMAKIRQGNLTLPVGNEVAVQVLSSLENENLSFRNIAELSKLDPSIHAGVLRIANSVHYGGAYGYITEMEKALVRLGINNVRTYLVNYVTKALKQNTDLLFNPEIIETIEASFFIGSAAYLIAEHAKMQKPDELFSIGLLHRIGMVFLYAVLSEHLAGKEVSEEVRMSYLTLTRDNHVSACIALMKRWNFPENYTIPINHQIDVQQTRYWQETKALHLAIAVYQAYQKDDESALKTDKVQNIMTEFNFQTFQIKALLEQIKDHTREMRAILG